VQGSAFELGLAGHGNGAGAIVGADADHGAEMTEHALAVIAGRHRFDDRGLAGRVEAREQDRRLYLGRRHRQSIGGRQGRRGSHHRQRQMPPTAGEDARAHRLQRLDHPAHRPGAERGVAGEETGDRLARHQSHQKSDAGPRVTQLENPVGLAKAADADAPDAPRAVFVAHDVGAQLAQCRGRRQHVVGFEKAMQCALADGGGGEHQGAVRDGLVARRAGDAGEFGDGLGYEWGQRDLALGIRPFGAWLRPRLGRRAPSSLTQSL
jgi:hypothetical protein